jgi:flagellar hook-basal body complex protein FliE
MPISGISGSPSAGIDQILAQIRNAHAKTQSPALSLGNGGEALSTGAVGQASPALNALRNNALGVSGVQTVGEAAAPGSFMSSLKASLDQVNASQNKAAELGKAFEKGDPNVDLNDVMVAVQKSSVSFQTAVQVRNRMVSAYHDIMNMQI